MKFLRLLFIVFPLALSLAAEETPAPATVSAPAPAPATTEVNTAVFERVKSELSQYPHRLPGSPEYYESIDKLEKVLVDSGINVKRQTFPTYVPEIVKNVFKVEGQNVQIHPLAPNNLALITTGREPIVGDVIYFTAKELRERYDHIDGRIVFLEWDNHEFPRTLFTEGAKAVVFVGNDTATQWDVAKLISQYNLSYPFFYITREEAAKHNLLAKYDPKHPRKAELSVVTRWKTVDGINLWAEIRSDDPQTFSLNQPEAVILGARLDTFGVVPGLVRSDRLTGNLALLAQTAADLAQKQLDRSVFLIFYGASFNAYDGLRHFYFPISIRNKRVAPTVFDYASGYKQELEDTQLMLDTLDRDPVVQKEDRFQYRTRLLLRDTIVEHYDNLNYRQQDINVELRAIQKTLKNAELKERDRVVLEKRLDVLNREKDALEKNKVNISNLRRGINERRIPPEYQTLLNDVFIKEVKTELALRKMELQTSIQSAECWKDIAEATRPYALIGAYFYDFSSDTQPFILATRSYENPHTSKEMDVSVYTKFFTELGKLLPNLKMQQGKTPLLEESIRVGTTPDSLSGRSLVYTPSSVGLAMKLSSFTMRNVPGKYDFDEIPGRHEYSLKGLLPMLDEFLTSIIQGEQFSMYSMLPDTITLDQYSNYYYKDGDYFGLKFDFLGPDGKATLGPAASAFAYIGHNKYDRILPMCGFSSSAFGQVNQSGYLTMPLVAIDATWPVRDFNPYWTGAMKFGEDGRVEYINTQAKAQKLFRCYGGSHVYAYAPLTSNFASCLAFANGVTDGKFINSQGYHRVATQDGYAYVDRDINVKMYWPDETHVLGSTSDHPYGVGISFEPSSLLNLNVSRIGIDNSIKINQDRLNRIHQRNIFNSVIEGYQDRAEQHQIEAGKARAEGNINLARAHELFGQTLAIRAYRPLKTLIDDLVKSVLILLILTIPFSFAMERLIIGATNIYKQMAWNLVFFVGTFLLLYFTHPAFVLSQAPMIIFIAFFIIVLSLVVIYIVMNRFKAELMALQGLDTSAHRENSENSMILAAILIGVSSMRNRPVKTFLTILTVVLLTFTIISFASFDSTGYVRPSYVGDSSGEVRIESFLGNHLDVLTTTSQAVRDMFKDDYDIYYRSASYHNPFYLQPAWPNQQNYIYNPASTSSKTLSLEAVVGFEPNEVLHSAKLAALMPKVNLPETRANKIPGVYLASTTADRLQLKVGDHFFLRTLEVRLDGIFNPSTLDEFSYLDEAKVSPPNFKATAEAEEKSVFKVLNETYVDSSNFIWSSPDVTMLTDYDTAMKVNGFLNAVILYPKEGHHPDMIADATKIAEVSFGIVYSNTANGVNRHFFTQGYVASGLSTVLVPLLLGALIILSSLLGSIADREREIFTFSALGLSPKDVSILFFAESGVYAVIGGLGGYLLSQLTTSAMNFLAKRGLLEAPEINYSSMTTVYTILIVMAIVLLSTIYPAIKAGRAANPDVVRKWKMPPPHGNNLVFQFPFTVSTIDFGGILVFISEHFANHSDSSLGSFAASNVTITHGQSSLTDGYMLTANLTLAPFDLGVAEEFHMYSAPSDIEGIGVVTVSIIRLDGSQGAWLRGNHRFVDEIRKQFLFWRSLPVETVMHYRELAARKFVSNSPEGVKS